MLDLSSFISQLSPKLSPESRVFVEADGAPFKELLLRWSDIGLKVPGAIVKPATEEDVVIAVKLASERQVPFVPKSGGHSLWSTIGADGFILDLTQLTNISVDKPTGRITLQSGVLTKQANEVAFQNGLCLPLGSANTAGVISMALGGGLSALSAVTGCTSDNIVSARVVTADGRLLIVNEDSHPDLFWGLRGAGQLLGLVTEITLQGYPLSVLGTDDGTIWTGAIVYPASRVKEVIDAMTPLVEDTTAPTAGLFLISSLPPSMETVIMILPFYLGPSAKAEAFYQPLLDLGPLSVELKNVQCHRQNDSVDPFCGKGDGFKRFAGAGATVFKSEVWPRVVEYFEELKTKCPDAAATAYAFEWDSYSPATTPAMRDTAFCHKEIKVWAELLSWYTDAASHKEVFRIEQETIAYFRSHYADEKAVTYQNWSRDVPLEQLYPDPAKLARLRALKNEWDPKGVFTKLLL
ncbi:hypothetical protein DFH06DRAFT_575473 [Mycena polygramma]|nr:hypothetical protein DFH06DRAFT_575473 [Mycena polygramma]